MAVWAQVRCASNRVQAILVSLYYFARFKIEHRPALRRPFASIMREYGGRGTEVTNGLDFFHATAFDRLKADRHPAQTDQLTVRAITGHEHALLKCALRPFQPSWLAARGGCLEEGVFERLLVADE